MAYTGTGTAQDPYLVSNFADFITLIKESGAYVKVTAPLTALPEDEITNYTNTYGEDGIGIRCAKIYADESTDISNVTVYGCEFIYINNGVTVENLNFKNATFFPTNSSNPNINNPIFYFNAGQNHCYFRNCSFSIQGNAGTNSVPLAYGQSAGFYHFDNCAIYCTFNRTGYTGGTAMGINYTAVEYTNCAIYLYGINGHSGSSVYLPTDSGLYRNCTLIYNIGVDSASSASATWFASGSNHNIIVVNIGSVDSFAVITFNGSLNCVDMDNSNISGASSVTYKLTEAQIKSESYLKSISFIP